MNSPTTRWGILATGAIAATIAADLDKVPGAVKAAVASRDQARAQAFADQHGFARAYGSYDQLLADPDIDVVYVATPHGQHHAVASQVLAAGKPALIEKSFTCSAAATEDLVRQAEAAGVFCMEAMWLRFQPALAAAREVVRSGAIGTVRAVQADLGFPAQVPASHRLLDPAKGGGALLDLGVYVVHIAQWFLGTASSVTTVGTLGPTGVDVEAGLLLGYPQGEHAVLSCSLTSASPGQAVIVGTSGRIVIPPRFHHPGELRVELLPGAGRGEPSVEVVANPLRGAGYAHELEHVGECLAQGLTQSPVLPLSDTVDVMRVLDAALEELGAPHVDEGFAGSGARR
ncbi:MAG: Gfo/Idh/MocA family protein [Actinomycetales bacterium]